MLWAVTRRGKTTEEPVYDILSIYTTAERAVERVRKMFAYIDEVYPKGSQSRQDMFYEALNAYVIRPLSVDDVDPAYRRYREADHMTDGLMFEMRERYDLWLDWGDYDER